MFDEPNANLDHDGEMAFLKTVHDLKVRGAIVITIAHRPSALAACDKSLYLANGSQQAFGPRDEVKPIISSAYHCQKKRCGGLKI